VVVVVVVVEVAVFVFIWFDNDRIAVSIRSSTAPSPELPTDNVASTEIGKPEEREVTGVVGVIAETAGTKTGCDEAA
jgi:hypothetical protein